MQKGWVNVMFVEGRGGTPDLHSGGSAAAIPTMSQVLNLPQSGPQNLFKSRSSALQEPDRRISKIRGPNV